MGFTPYGRRLLLDSTFMSGARPSTVYFALTSTVPGPVDDGALLVEPPASTNYARVSYTVTPNLLTENQATCGDALGTTAGFSSYQSTLEVESGRACFQGEKSIKITSIGAQTATWNLSPNSSVLGGSTYTAMTSMSNGSFENGMKGVIVWRGAGGTTLSTLSLGSYDTSSGWFTHRDVLTAPDAAVSAQVQVYGSATAAGQFGWVDALGLFAGDVEAWAPPGGGFYPVSSGEITNSVGITFPTPSADWGMLRGWAMCTTATVGGGLVIVSGALTQPRRASAGSALRVNIDAIKLTLR